MDQRYTAIGLSLRKRRLLSESQGVEQQEAVAEHFLNRIVSDCEVTRTCGVM
jgi:hypothetical protein